jgi:hypothetical protein
MTRTMLRIGLLLTCLATPVIACSEADTAIDCGSICDRYRECFDEDYDVEACAENCQEEADRSEDYRDTADDCHACIDDASCVGGGVSCLTECIGVVP